MDRRLTTFFGFFLLVAAGVVVVLLMASGSAMAAEDLSNDVCLACHGDASVSTPLGNGKSLSLYVDHKALAGSVHSGLACTDCHSDITTVPHATKTFANKRAVSLAYYQVCKQCHFAQYSRLLDGMHLGLSPRATQVRQPVWIAMGRTPPRRRPTPARKFPVLALTATALSPPSTSRACTERRWSSKATMTFRSAPTVIMPTTIPTPFRRRGTCKSHSCVHAATPTSN